MDIRLQITSAGRADWPPVVLVAAGLLAVAFYACRLGVPRRALLSAAALGGIAAALARGLTPLSVDLSRPARTLLPAPATLVPALAETEPARQALQGLAAETAFLIGVGVASGSILVETYQRHRARVLEPVVGAVRPIRTRARRTRRRAEPATDGSDAEHGGPR